MKNGAWSPYNHLVEMANAASRLSLDVKRLADNISSDIGRVAGLFPDFDEFDEVEKKFIDLMIRSDWPPPFDVSAVDVMNLVRSHDRNPEAVEATIDEWVMDRCSENALRAAVEAWRLCPLCHRRMPPLEAAVRAHLGEQYFCSIPVLLAQTEGLMLDYIGEGRGRLLNSRMRKKARQSLDLAADADVTVRFRRALRMYYLEAVMGSLEPDTAPQGSLRRHLILHGGDCTYGTRAMSWKALMLFDAIVESLEVALVDGEDCLYHLPACDRCRDAPAEAVKYVHIADTKALAGRSPCQVCAAPNLHVDESSTDATQ